LGGVFVSSSGGGDIALEVSVVQTEIDEAVAVLDELLNRLGAVDVVGEALWVEMRVEEVVVQGEKQLDVLEQKVTATEAGLGNLVAEGEDNLRGMNWSIRRVTSMIPGIRDAYRMVQSMKRINMMGLSSVGGVVSIALLVYSLYRMFAAYVEEQKRKEKELRDAIMSVRGYEYMSEYRKYIEEQKRVAEYYRHRSIR